MAKLFLAYGEKESMIYGVLFEDRVAGSTVFSICRRADRAALLDPPLSEIWWHDICTIFSRVLSCALRFVRLFSGDTAFAQPRGSRKDDWPQHAVNTFQLFQRFVERDWLPADGAIYISPGFVQYVYAAIPVQHRAADAFRILFAVLFSAEDAFRGAYHVWSQFVF